MSHDDEPSPDPFYGFVAFLMILVVAALLAMTSSGCSPSVQMPKSVSAVPVAIVAWPAPIKPECSVEEEGEVPDITMYNAQTTASQYFVPLVEMMPVLEHLRQSRTVNQQLRACLAKVVHMVTP